MARSVREQHHTVRRIPFVGSDKLIYAIDGISPFMLHLIMELHGPLDVLRLTEAIERALEATPVLKSRAQLRWIRPYWEVIEDFAPETILTVRDYSSGKEDQAAIRSLIGAFLNETIDITSSAPTRFLLIRLSDVRWVFVVKIHHSPLDAAGLFIFVNDIKTYYERLCRGETVRPLVSMGERSRRPLFRRVTLSLWRRAAWAALRRALSDRPSRPRRFIAFSAPAPEPGISYRSVVFEGEDYAAFRARCKSLGVTGQELIMAALCRTIHRWNGASGRGDGVYSIIMPVDLRRYARRGGRIPRIMASFVGGTRVTIPAVAAETLEGALARIVEDVRYIRTHHLALIPNVIFPLLVFVPSRWLRWAARRTYRRHPERLIPTAVVTNVGRVDRILSSSPTFSIRAMEGVGTAYVPAGLFVAPLSFGRRQTITITYRKDACSEEEMASFVELFVEELLPSRRTRRARPGVLSSIPEERRRRDLDHVCLGEE
ncbi:MAG: hypothetical protein D6723_07175 [Acidobacteria bacterium]|nr:MAG: hypothetical protein D6723_07175 [Acidobacteriota bacterium]